MGLLVLADEDRRKREELDGATVCVGSGTTTELNLADYFRANKMKYKPVVIEATQEVEEASFSGHCRPDQ